MQKMTDNERIRELHNKRHSMGLCIYCSCMIDNPQYRTCASCRAKSREKSAEFRRKMKEMEEQRKALQLKKLKGTENVVPEDHKCWTCEWSRFEGDRFFCPFVEGTCVKEDKK